VAGRIEYMRGILRGMALCVAILFIAFNLTEVRADIIKFKKGGKKKCVIEEETETSVRFLTQMGPVTTPLERIDSIERESDEVNKAIKDEWEKKATKSSVVRPRKKAKKQPDEVPQAKTEEPEAERVYDIKITKRKVTPTAVGSGYPAATFRIEDFGEVKGGRLFRVIVINYRTTARSISSTEFYALMSNGMRLDPRPIKGYPLLDARVGYRKTGSGYLAFPGRARLRKLVMRGQIADFELDLDTGGFVTRGGVF